MKKTTKYFMATIMMMSTLCFVACSKDDDKKTDESTQPATASATFDILYMGRELEPFQTVYFNLTASEVETDDVEVSLYVKNKANTTMQRVFKVELVEGPTSMAIDAPICYGVCEPHNLPYTSNAVDLAPGIDENPIQIHLYPSFHESAHTGTYKVTVGKGADLEDPQVCFVKFTW